MTEAIRHEVPMCRQLFDVARWQTDGFATAQESAWWSDRACGVACMRMMLLGWFGQASTPAELLHQARADGAYLRDRGWSHAGLARLGARHGLPAEAVTLPEDEIVGHLERAPVIVSVKIKFPVGQGRGGHLVVLTGAGSGPSGAVFGFNDPSSWGQRHCWVPRRRFCAAYSGRALLFPQLDWGSRGAAS